MPPLCSLNLGCFCFYILGALGAGKYSSVAGLVSFPLCVCRAGHHRGGNRNLGASSHLSPPVFCRGSLASAVSLSPMRALLFSRLTLPSRQRIPLVPPPHSCYAPPWPPWSARVSLHTPLSATASLLPRPPKHRQLLPPAQNVRSNMTAVFDGKKRLSAQDPNSYANVGKRSSNSSSSNSSSSNSSSSSSNVA